jgi:DNA-binding NtrC family response regulator/tetratricopeptide (TPR) repeat protein
MAWAVLGNSRWYRAEHDRARECYERSLALAHQTGYRNAEKVAITNLATIAGNQARFEQALELYHRGLRLDEETRDFKARAQTLRNIAWALDALGRTDEALEYLYRAIEVAEEHGPERAGLMAQSLIADVYVKRGDYSRALQLYEQVVEAGLRLHDPELLVPTLIDKGLLLVRKGDLAAGRSALEQAQEICNRAGNHERTRPDVFVAMAELALAEGRLAEADALLQNAENELDRASGRLREQGYASLVRAQLYARHGHETPAQRSFQAAADACAARGDNDDLARVRLKWGTWLAESGRTEDALPLLEQSVASARRLGSVVIADQASSLLFELRTQADREAALLGALADLAKLGLNPDDRLERMCEVVAKAFGCDSGVILFEGEPVVVYGKPDLVRAEQLCRRKTALLTGADTLFLLNCFKGKAGIAWFERPAPSGVRLNSGAVERVTGYLCSALVLVARTRRRCGVSTTSSPPGLRFRGVAGENPAMLECLGFVSRLAGSSVPVLIRGESGTGKELVARSLHDSGPRWNQPFVAVNCAAVPEGLLEAEFFGVEKGAATGVVGRPGKFEQAHGGTIFLDEIRDMSLDLQARLLRVLEEKTLTRVGGTKEIVVDARVVAATNEDLLRLVRDGKFREDLYFRLNVCELVIPPLRERTDDIPALARHLIGQARSVPGREPTEMEKSFLDALRRYNWPGNIRELRNVIERSVLTCNGEKLTAHDLPRHIREARPEQFRPFSAPATSRGPLTAHARRQMERRKLLEFLEQTGWNVRASARLAGCGHTKFYRLLHKHNIRRRRP